eukprot:TRINITY_DN5950_c0_g1_i1.p1 TRINITY_DN5950_c0_g1~~TRINITY_DN5950_c0_g1_i1.p1  ORF type:complete len:102 (+),score=4.68 TRINITY_DN5950_c0_g1_i1:294-599(+)
MFDQMLLISLDFLDRDCVSKVISPSGRSFFEVESFNAQKSYQVLTQYCSCEGYSYKVRDSDGPILCKHQLAVKLAEALGKFSTRTVTDIELATMLSREDEG